MTPGAGGDTAGCCGPHREQSRAFAGEEAVSLAGEGRAVPCRAGACAEVVQNEFCPATKAAVLRCVSIPTRLCRGAFV